MASPVAQLENTTHRIVHVVLTILSKGPFVVEARLYELVRLPNGVVMSLLGQKRRLDGLPVLGAVTTQPNDLVNRRIVLGASAGAVVAELFVLIGFLDKFEPALVISGMAAVTGAVIGAPICMVVIVMELTSSYTYALASLVGLTLSVSLSHILFGASYFDKQLATRGVDISTGRSGMLLMEKKAADFASDDFIALSGDDIVANATLTMSEKNKNEIIVLDKAGKFIGKIELHALINKDVSEKIKKFADKNCVTIKSDASLQQAMEAAANFVGEAIPIIDRQTNRVVSVITEGAIFEAYLNIQDTVIDMEKR